MRSLMLPIHIDGDWPYVYKAFHLVAFDGSWTLLRLVWHNYLLSGLRMIWEPPRTSASVMFHRYVSPDQLQRALGAGSH